MIFIQIDVLEIMKQVPDLERQISRIHAAGRVQQDVMKHHTPFTNISKAIMFGDQDARKLRLFLNILSGFRQLLKIIKFMEPFASKFRSKYLQRLCTISDGGFPDISDLLEQFETAFDHEIAKERGFHNYFNCLQYSGAIHPSPGTNKLYDEAVAEIDKYEEVCEHSIHSPNVTATRKLP